jgi:hypothetical protein
MDKFHSPFYLMIEKSNLVFLTHNDACAHANVHMNTKKNIIKFVLLKFWYPIQSLLSNILRNPTRLPTDYKLIESGCNLPFMCSLFHCYSETMFHLFLECRFAFGIYIWCWLDTTLDILPYSSFNG